jgi:hypothetical protein
MSFLSFAGIIWNLCSQDSPITWNFPPRDVFLGFSSAVKLPIFTREYSFILRSVVQQVLKNWLAEKHWLLTWAHRLFKTRIKHSAFLPPILYCSRPFSLSHFAITLFQEAQDLLITCEQGSSKLPQRKKTSMPPQDRWQQLLWNPPKTRTDIMIYWNTPVTRTV